MIQLNKKHSIDFTKILDPHSKKWQSVASPMGPFCRSDSEAAYLSCKVCHKVTESVCPKCLDTPYCSAKCWNTDKPDHVDVCGQKVAYKLMKDPESGNFYYVVLKSIEQGKNILIDDIPVVLPTLPEEYREDADKPMHAFPRICFGCHKHFYPDDEKQEVCTGCGIAKCSIYCHALYHTETECEVLKAVFGRNYLAATSSSRKYVELYLDICLLRVMRSFSHGDSNAFVAERYRKFTLLSKTSRFKQFSKGTKDPYDGVAYMSKLNKSVDRLQMCLGFALYNREIVQQVYKTMIVFWQQYESEPGVMSRLLFLDRNFMTHSYCSPNVAATLTFDPNKSGPTWITFTTKEINVIRDGNVPLLFDFSPCRFMPLPLRMLYLNENGFKQYCQRKEYCSLCCDPSDGDTHSGSIKCLKCCKGLYIEGQVRGKDLLLNEFPVRWSADYVNTVDWKCNECDDVQPFSLILEVNRTFERAYVDGIRNKFGSSRLLDISKFVDSCEKYLHELNGVILRAKYDFVMAAREKHLHECGFTSTGLPLDEYFESKVSAGVTKRDSLKVRLFPVNWNHEELRNTKLRASYLRDCMKYLEGVRSKTMGKAAMENYTDFSFLRTERILIELVCICYRFLEKSDPKVGAELEHAGRETARVIQDYGRKRLMQFGFKLSNTDPFLKWPLEMRYFGDLLDKMNEPQFIARLILQSMRINVDEFLMKEE